MPIKDAAYYRARIESGDLIELEIVEKWFRHLARSEANLQAPLTLRHFAVKAVNP